MKALNDLESYFDQEVMDEMIERHQKRENTPSWFVEALKKLSEKSHEFDAQDDSEETEFIYPH